MDDFTEKLLERTRARKEILAKKMNENNVSPVKRRAPLAENTQNVFAPKENSMHKSASPTKRKPSQDMKPDTPAIRSVRSRLQHLAHARDVWDSESGDCVDVPSPHKSCKTPEINLETLPPQPVTRKARFAALAADINNWVDDTNHPKHQPEEEKKKPTRKFFTEPKSDDQPRPAPRSSVPIKNSTTPSPKKRTMLEKTADSPGKSQTSSISPKKRTMSVSTVSSPRKEQTSAPSPKKRNIQSSSPCKKPSSPLKGSPKKRTVAFAVTGTPNPVPRSGLHIATLRQVPQAERQVCTEVKKPTNDAVSKEPVTRTVTNQYKAIGRGTYEVSRDRPAALPVPKKTPIKRQAPEAPKSPAKTPLKPVTSTKIQRMVAQISAKEKILKSPENVSDHVGEMAKSIRTRLLEHQNSWQKNEINTKIQAERKKELEAIRQRWAESSTKSRTLSSEPEEHVEETVESEVVAMTMEEAPIKEHQEEENELVEAEEDDDDEMAAEDAGEETEEKVTDVDDEDENEGSEFNDDDLNVSDVLGDIDEILDQEEQAMEEEEEARNTLQEVETIQHIAQDIKQDESEEEEAAEEDIANEPTPPPRQVKPLTYSVSTYRNQRKKALTLPPSSRTVVMKSPEAVQEEEEAEEEQPATPKAKQLTTREKVKALNDEVSTQQSIIQQTSQALNLINAKPDYKGTMEEVEAERLLLIATQRRLACLGEIQHLKSQASRTRKSSSEEDGLTPCQGSVTVRDIKLPLKTEYILAVTSGQDRPHHFFFVLVKHGAKVIASQLLSSRKALSGDCLPFSNMMAFNDLDGNFMLELEVYQLNLNRIKHEVPEKSKGLFSNITPKKLKSVRQGGRSQLLTSPGGPGAVRTSNFILVGSIRLCLNSINTERFMLSKVPFGAPIEGNIHLRMSCHSESRVIQRGFITMFDDISGFGSWHRRWLVLAGSKIAYWKYPDDEKRKDPINVIDLKKCVTREVSLLTRLVCARPNTFELMTRRRATDNDKSSLVAYQQGSVVTTKFWLSADSKEEREKWICKLNKSLLDLRTWNRDAAKPIDPPKPSETDL